MRWWKAIPHLQVLEEEEIVAALFGGKESSKASCAYLSLLAVGVCRFLCFFEMNYMGSRG